MLIVRRLYFTIFQTLEIIVGLEYGSAEMIGYQLITKSNMPNTPENKLADEPEKVTGGDVTGNMLNTSEEPIT